MTTKNKGKTASEIADWLGYLSVNEVDYLHILTRGLPESAKIVNIGAGGGTSTIACLEARPDVVVFSIDLFKDEREYLVSEHLRLSDLDWMMRRRAVRIWGDSYQTAMAWPVDWLVDMVFVDGDHTREGVTKDIDGWIGHIRANGIIAFHDHGGLHWPELGGIIDNKMSGNYPHFKPIGHIDTIKAYKWTE